MVLGWHGSWCLNLTKNLTKLSNTPPLPPGGRGEVRSLLPHAPPKGKKPGSGV